MIGLRRRRPVVPAPATSAPAVPLLWVRFSCRDCPTDDARVDARHVWVLLRLPGAVFARISMRCPVCHARQVRDCLAIDADELIAAGASWPGLP